MHYIGGFYNTLLGNYNIFDDHLRKENNVVIECYVEVLYFTVSLYLQIIMMNLIISFLGDAYSKVNEYFPILN